MLKGCRLFLIFFAVEFFLNSSLSAGEPNASLPESCGDHLAAIARYLGQIADKDQVPTELQLKFVQNIGDAGIYRRGKQLLLLRLKGLDIKDALIKPLSGEELDSENPPKFEHGHYIIHTKQGNYRWLSLWDKEFEKTEIYSENDAPIKKQDLPNQSGMVFYSKSKLIFLIKPTNDSIGSHHSGVVFDYAPAGIKEITGIEFVDSPLPLVAIRTVDYIGKSVTHYLEYSASVFPDTAPQLGNSKEARQKITERNRNSAYLERHHDFSRLERIEPPDFLVPLVITGQDGPAILKIDDGTYLIFSDGSLDQRFDLKFARLRPASRTDPGSVHLYGTAKIFVEGNERAVGSEIPFNPLDRINLLGISNTAEIEYDDPFATIVRLTTKNGSFAWIILPKHPSGDAPQFVENGEIVFRDNDDALTVIVSDREPQKRSSPTLAKTSTEIPVSGLRFFLTGNEPETYEPSKPLNVEIPKLNDLGKLRYEVFSEGLLDQNDPLISPSVKVLPFKLIPPLKDRYHYSIVVGKKPSHAELFDSKDRKNITVKTSHKIKSFSRTHPLFSGDEAKDLLFAEIEDPSDSGVVHTLIIDLVSGKTVSIPGLAKVERFQRDLKGIVENYSDKSKYSYSHLILGRDPKNPNRTVYTIWDSETHSFHPNHPSGVPVYQSDISPKILLHTLKTKDDSKEESEDQPSSQRLAIIPTSLENININFDLRNETIFLHAKKIGDQSETLGFWLPLNAEVKPVLMLNPRPLLLQTENDSLGPDVFVSDGASLEVSSIGKLDSLRVTEGDAGDRSVLLILQSRAATGNHTPTLRTIRVEGKPTAASYQQPRSDTGYEQKPGSLTVTTTKTLLGLKADGQFDIFLGSSLQNTPPVYGTRRDIEYRDENFHVTTTTAFGQQPPMLILSDLKTGEKYTVRLNFTPKSQKADQKSQLLDFLSLILGVPTQEKESPGIENRNPISKVSREGDLLLVSTEGGGDSGPLTYLISLRDKTIIFAIPNLQRTIKIGNYLYFVGQATSNNKTVVVQLGADAYQYVNHYDLGKLPLDITREIPIETDNEKNQVRFHMADGIDRIFDLEQNNFLGLIPKDIEEILADANTNVGTVINRSVFEKPPRRSYGRSEFETQLREAYPLVSSAASRHTLIVGDRGVGSSHAIDTYIDTFLSGKNPNRAGFKPVFFRLEASKMEGADDSSYVNAAARKFKILQTAAEALANKGYRLVVLVDGLERVSGSYGAKVHGETWNPAADIYTGLSRLMEDNIVDVLATSTPDGYSSLVRSQAHMMNQFANRLDLPVMLRQTTADSLRQYLKDKKIECPELDATAIDRMLMHLEVWSPMRSFPGIAFEVFDDVLAKVGNKMTYQDLIDGVARKTGVPSILVNQEKLHQVEEQMRTFLNERVVGQPDAIEQVVNSVMSFAHGVNRRDAPVASLMFPGPTGVGKTELARALSEFLFGDQKRLLIINGEAYSAPPGTGDIEKLRNTIMEHIKKYPFNILLTDEFEKMHPDYQAVVLSLGDGKMTGTSGDVVRTNLSVFVATTNIGSEKIRTLSRSIGFGKRTTTAADYANTFMKAARDGFRPEVIGRFDKIIPFNPLDRDASMQLIRNYLLEGKNLPALSIYHRFKLKGIELDFDPSVFEYMIQNYIDLELGARRLAKNIETDFVQGTLTPQVGRSLKSGKRYRISRSENRFVIQETQ